MFFFCFFCFTEVMVKTSCFGKWDCMTAQGDHECILFSHIIFIPPTYLHFKISTHESIVRNSGIKDINWCG